MTLRNLLLKVFVVTILAAGMTRVAALSSLTHPAKLSSLTHQMNGTSMQHPIKEDKIVEVLSYTMWHYDEHLSQYYEQLSTSRKDPLQFTLEYFLGAPYLFEALGEGPEGRYSQEPLYRTDLFDCVTYVDTVLSLIHAKNLEEFKKNILTIRYQGPVKYRTRTDWFTDLEWLPHVQHMGWIKDVTSTLVDQQHRTIAKTAVTIIDKPNWYRVKPLNAMHRKAPLPDDRKSLQLLQKLRAKAKWYRPVTSKLSYIPISRLFSEGNAIDYLFNQIPSGSVIAIVRPDWPIRDQFPGFPEGYGTNLNVSHLGIVIRTTQGLMFYNASSLQQKVVAEPLDHYLQKYIDHPTIKGIHVEKIL